MNSFLPYFLIGAFSLVMLFIIIVTLTIMFKSKQARNDFFNALVFTIIFFAISYLFGRAIASFFNLNF